MYLTEQLQCATAALQTSLLIMLSYFILYQGRRLNSLPNDKILLSTKLKAFADDKLNVAEN